MTVGKKIYRLKIYRRLTVGKLIYRPITVGKWRSGECDFLVVSSIQSWLDNGNTTCPATMQSLSSPSFVPNLTLHRLIHLWSHSHSYASSLSPASPSLSSLLVANPKDITLSLKKIFDRVKKSEANRRVLDESDEFLCSLVELMVKSVEVCDLELIFLILEVFDEQKIRKLMTMKLFDCLEKFVFVLLNGSVESKIAVAKIVTKISTEKETRRLLIETKDLISGMFKLVESNFDHLIVAGLAALISVASTKSVKIELVKLEMVRRLREIIVDRFNEKTIQYSMEMMEVMATCTEGRAAICEDEDCVAEVVKRLMKVSEKVTEHGVTVLWSVCYIFRDDKVKEIVGRSNGLGVCLLLLQSNCKPIVKQMCRELVKVLRSDYSKSCLDGYNTKTIHIMPY